MKARYKPNTPNTKSKTNKTSLPFIESKK